MSKKEKTTPKKTTKKVAPKKVDNKTTKVEKEIVKKIEKEPVKVEQKKVESKKVEPKKVEPKKVEPKKVEPKKVENEKEIKTKEAVKELAENKEAAKMVIKDDNKKGIFQRIFDIVFWVAIIGLTIIWLTDFINFKQDKEPSFCIKEIVHQFDDGTVKECDGLGYKIFEYNRSSFEHSRQFGPFFIKMKEK